MIVSVAVCMFDAFDDVPSIGAIGWMVGRHTDLSHLEREAYIAEGAHHF